MALRICVAFLLFCLGCSVNRDCDTAKIDVLLKERFTSISVNDSNYKKNELRRKKALFSKFCKIKGDMDNFILMEMRGEDARDWIGILYDYNEHLLYSFKQRGSTTKIEKGNHFDRHGTLSYIFYKMRGDVIQQIDSVETERSKFVIPDQIPIYIYYLDMKRNRYKYSILSNKLPKAPV